MQLDPLAADDDRAEERLDGENDAASTFLTFDLDGQTFAVAVRCVREILDTLPVTRLPNAPPEIMGVIDVRGTSVPIVDLGGSLGVAGDHDGVDTRIVVFELGREGGAPCPVGIVADRVRDVCRIEASEIEDPPACGTNSYDEDLVLGLCRRDGGLVVLVDQDQLFARQQIAM